MVTHPYHITVFNTTIEQLVKQQHEIKVVFCNIYLIIFGGYFCGTINIGNTFFNNILGISSCSCCCVRYVPPGYFLPPFLLLLLLFYFKYFLNKLTLPGLYHTILDLERYLFLFIREGVK